MSFIAKHVNAPEKDSVPSAVPVVQENTDFTKEELEYLLRMLGDANLKGREVEMFYNLIIKLQNLYVKK